MHYFIIGQFVPQGFTCENYTKGCFLKVRNFKKTLSLILSVLMVVSCCSVVLSTFATAYTTNDGTNPKYGVYTYDFVTKDANGNAIDTYPNQNHDILNAGSYKWPGTQDPQSYISISGEEKGLHMTSSYEAKTTTVGAANYMSKTFLRDPDSAISLTNNVDTGCYLVMKRGVTYTFVVKYKVEDITEGNTGIIGIGMFDYANTVSATAGAGGTVQVIGFSEARSSVDREWQYYTVSVNADSLSFKTKGPSDGEMYVVLTAGSMTKHSSDRGDVSKGYVTFHVESVTVAAVDNKYSSTYGAVDSTTADGSLTENMQIAPKTHVYDFRTASAAKDYAGAKHNLLSCGPGGGDKDALNNSKLSYVDSTGVHMAVYNSTSGGDNNTYRNRMFVKGSANSISTNNFLALDGAKDKTYTLILKYKLESLDPDGDGTKAANAQIGLGFWSPSSTNITLSSLNQTTGQSGETKGFKNGYSDVFTAPHTDWQYLVTTVNTAELGFGDGTKTSAGNGSITDFYVQIYAKTGNSDKFVMFNIESLTVIALDNATIDLFDVTDDTVDGSLTEKAKVEYNGYIEYNMDLENFYANNAALKGSSASSNHGYTGGTADNSIEYTTFNGTHGTDYLSGYTITKNADGSLNIKPTNADQRGFFYTGQTKLSDKLDVYGGNAQYLRKNAYRNSVVAQTGYTYYFEVILSISVPEDAGAGNRFNIVASGLANNYKGTWKSYSDVSTAITVNPGETLDHYKYTATIAGDSYDGKAFLFRIDTNKKNTPAGTVTIHSAKVVACPTATADTIVIEESGLDTVVYNANGYKGMTLPRPADKNGKLGSHWVDSNNDAVAAIPTAGLTKISAIYKNHTIDFDSAPGYYAPGNRFAGEWSRSAKISADPLDATNNTLHFYNYMWASKTVEGEKKYYYSGTNTANVSLTDAIDGQSGIKVKPNTEYTINFKYYVKSLAAGYEDNAWLDIYQSNADGIGQDNPKESTGLPPYKEVIQGKIFLFTETTDGWVDASITFTTLDEETTAKYPYILFKPVGGQGTLSDNLYDSKTDPAALAEVDTLTNIYFDDFEFFETVTENAAADSYVSIREEIAANEQTSALRVSAAISEAAANAASEIGFIALPTKKATDDWYKFDAAGKLANGALSVKVKDVNGLGITGHEDITELLAPTTVPVADGQKAYQVSITGLQAIGKTGAGLRNDAISVVLYTKAKNGNYTYYFVNEVSYDQTMTMYAMGGKDIAKYEY